MDFLLELARTYGIPGIVGVAVAVLVLWAIADRIGKPGTEVSVLWGLVKYVKRGGEQAVTPISHPPNGSSPDDEKVVEWIQSEAPSLLSVARSTPCGLWLAAESLSLPRDTLLLTSRQIRSEHRAEALAHLSLALTVFNKTKEAREVAEQSLSAAAEVQDTSRSYTYTKLAEKLLEANLTSSAQQAAEQAVEKARAGKGMENYRHVTQIYARAFSPDRALAVARAIQDPKARGEALEAIIAEYIENGDKKAADVIEEALGVSQKIIQTSDRAHAYSARAREWMRIGRYEEAARAARQAKQEAEKISPQEPFGQVLKNAITGDMNLLEVHPLAVLKAAEEQGNPRLLAHLARFLPKRAPETIQIIRSASDMATRARMPDALAEAADLFDWAGLSRDAQLAAQKTMELALNATERRFRDIPLQKAAEILAKGGDHESALSAASGISTPKQGAETILRVLLSAYARTGRASASAVDIINRLHTACARLDDKDRSAAFMQLACGRAFLGDAPEAYQTAKPSPLSGHRLAAYAIIMLAIRMESLPSGEAAKIRSGHGEAFEKMILPILGWDLAS